MESLQDGAGVQLGKAQGQEKAAIPCWTGENLPFFLIGILVFITEKSGFFLYTECRFSVSPVCVIQMKCAEKAKKGTFSTLQVVYRHCHFVFILDMCLAPL